MPEKYKRHLSYTLWMVSLFILLSSSASTKAQEGIGTYYIRYDVKSSKNKIADDNLLMIPSKNDFRAVSFSQIFSAGFISTAPDGSGVSVETRIRENALKTILVNHGLKSLKTKDYDTVVSYEGVIITPLIIHKKTYNEEQNKCFYNVEAEFSPIAFPDKWETMNMTHKLKKTIYEFFEFFK